MDEFIKLVQLSLDNDLATMVGDRKLGVEMAMQLQTLRILRGRPFHVELNTANPAPVITTGGWSPDGVQWFAQEPGNATTGNGPIPPETKS